MNSTSSYSDKVIDYILAEFDSKMITQLMIPEYADAVGAILTINSINNINIQNTAMSLIGFIKNQQIDKV